MTHIFDLASHPAKPHVIAADGDFGSAEHIDVPGVEGVITRVVACNGRLVVIDHDGALGCI